MNKFTAPVLLLSLMASAPLFAQNATATTSEPESADVNLDRTLVTVNGVSISAKELSHFMSKQATPKSPENAIREMINVELLNQAARNENLMKNETLQLEIKRATSALVASSYLQNLLSKLDISDAELEARYKADYVNNPDGKEFNANHILVKTEQEARDIIARLDKGENFEELAKQLSTGPSGKNGGSLGWFQKSDMVSEFSDATAQLQAGKYSSDPVQTQFGWHVILLNEIREATPPALDSVRKELATAIAGERIRQRLESLQDAATIEFN